MLKPGQTIRPVEIKSNLPEAGIGYVSIPDLPELDIEQYIDDCYRTHTITLYGGVHHGYFYNVSVSRATMQQIEFPKEKGKFGSPVVWVKIKPWNKPAIIAVMKYDDEYINTNEGEINISKTFDGNNIDISMRSKDGVIDVGITTKAGIQSQLNINLISPDDSAEFNVFAKGNIKLHATKNIKVITDKELSITVIDDDENVETEFFVDKNGYTYKDANNSIEASKDGIIIKADKKIIHNEDKEHAVLGDTLEKILEDLINTINKLTVQTTMGPSSIPINKSEFDAIKSRLKNIKSEKSFLC